MCLTVHTHWGQSYGQSVLFKTFLVYEVGGQNFSLLTRVTARSVLFVCCDQYMFLPNSEGTLSFKTYLYFLVGPCNYKQR